MALLALTVCRPASAGVVARGDANNDGSVDVTDAIILFEWLTSNPGMAICLNATDTNLDGVIDYADGIYLLQYMFLSGDEPLPFDPADETGCQDGSGSLEVRDLTDIVIAPTSAMIGWETPYRSDTAVRFGTDPDSLDREVRVDESVHYHQALLAGLLPGETYHYVAESSTANGDVVTTPARSFTTVEEPELVVTSSHPRLFFNEETLPEIRARIAAGGPHQDLWRSVSGWARSKATMTPEEIWSQTMPREHLRALAFVGLVGNDPTCRQKAIETALVGASMWPGENLRYLTEGLAYVYDWLHDYLSADAKTKIRSTLYKSANAYRTLVTADEFITGHSHGDNKSFFLAALAIHGDDDRAEALLAKAVENYRHGFLGTFRRFASWDGGSSKGWWYSTYALPYEFEFFAAWRSATGQDLFQTERVWSESILDWFLHGLRGDNTFMREGDVYSSTFTYEVRHMGRLLAKEYGNPRAQWLADRAQSVIGVWSPHAVMDILWSDPSVTPLAPAGATSKWFRNAGVVLCRDSWEDDAVVAMFRSAEAYTLGHSHLDSCSFTLFYKAELAMDTGVYDDYDGHHHANYYSRTIAHNSITVFDPNEVFAKWGDVHSNDGGQRWLVRGVDAEKSGPASAEETVDRSAGFRLGGITRYEQDPLFTYAVGDGGPAYSPLKMQKFHRHFLWLGRVAGWSKPVLVVFDDVVATSAAFRKAYLLHTAEQPTVSGRRVSVRKGDGALHQWTVSPSDAQIDLVGGKGKEFFVDGQNYPPLSPPTVKDDAGAWRVEVSPGAKRKADRFLHVLFPGDPDDAAPAAPAAVTAGGMEGAAVGDWVVLFGTGERLLLAEYATTRDATRHLIAGAVPLGNYEVYLDGALVETRAASFSGVLRFDLGAAGQVRVVAKP